MRGNVQKILAAALFLVMMLNPLTLFADEAISEYGLSFNDFIRLYENKNYKKEVTDKILSTPIVDNSINSNNHYTYKSHPTLKDLIVIGQWDLMYNLDPSRVYDAFFAPDKLVAEFKKDFAASSIFMPDEKDHPIESLNKVQEKICNESKILSSSDIIVLNNVDIGMPRTKYRNTPKELAQMLSYNYAFAPEFIEVDPATLGIEDYKWSDSHMITDSKSADEYIVDKEKYRGLTGTAILSRFPLKNVRVIPLVDVYDWYDSEKNNQYKLEDVSRQAMKSVFKEDTLRQIRIGHRVALVADIELPEETFTIVAVQIEKRTRPNERAKQMKYLLSQIKDIKHPVIMAGNLNTSCYNHQPKGVKNIIKNKFSDPDSIAETAFSVIVPVGMVVSWIVRPVFDIFRKVNDPTVVSIPLVSPNREKKMFNAIRRFEFDDGCKFDFRGNPETSVNHSSKMFSSSNERGKKGYISTYKTKRNLGVSNYKLSWIMAKGYNTDNKPKNNKVVSEKMSPHFGRTLYDLNFSYAQPISIQAPIVAVFPLSDYKKK